MDEVKVKIIGCGDAFSSGGRFTTSFFCGWRNKGFLLDCGATILPAMKAAGISSNDVDVIFISHLHGDHFGGLPYFLLDASIRAGRKKSLTIVGPPGIEQKTNDLLSLLYPGSSNTVKTEFIEFQTYYEYEIQGVKFKSFPVIHSKGTLPHGYRVSFGNKTIAYSGDTGWTDVLYELADDADLFICECNFVETQMKGHINFKQLNKNLDKINAKKVLLTHMGEEMLKENIGSPEKAYDGMELAI